MPPRTSKGKAPSPMRAATDAAVKLATETTRKARAAVGTAAEPVLSTALKVLEGIDGTQADREDVKGLVDRVRLVAEAIQAAVPPINAAPVHLFASQLSSLQMLLEEITSATFALKTKPMWKSLVNDQSVSSKIKDFTTRLDRSLEAFAVASQISASLSVQHIKCGVTTLLAPEVQHSQMNQEAYSHIS
ncbi:hypothetical protein CALCODRAFT_527899 [Calocera cornea HHB12733]|uniref:Uncharacterized protein n=1 Tax=Calocera cornea HHB12733 TaxID=1353952 RepID=A0A165E2L6_9BASI|nr:hypothetical protein CALCODRAFT_527899 [Calocera cornea HHB12733]